MADDKIEDKIDKVIIEFFAALKELGELRRRYDNVIGKVNVTFRIFSVYVCLVVGLSALG